MKYYYSELWTLKAREIAKSLGFQHIALERISCIESKGSKAKRTIARIHTIGKAIRIGMKEQPFYVIELLEKFSKQSEEEKTKTIIHELLHIPHSFGGGFRGHKHYVNEKTVERHFENFKHSVQGSAFQY